MFCALLHIVALISAADTSNIKSNSFLTSFPHQIEVVSLVSVCLAVCAMLGPLKQTYEEKYDRFGNFHVPNEFGIVYLAVPCLILAIVFHPWVWWCIFPTHLPISYHACTYHSCVSRCSHRLHSFFQLKREYSSLHTHSTLPCISSPSTPSPSIPLTHHTDLSTRKHWVTYPGHCPCISKPLRCCRRSTCSKSWPAIKEAS